MTMQSSWGARAALLSVVLLGVPGCSFFAAQNARHASIVRDLDALVYNSPCEGILQQARGLLFDRGMSVRDTGGSTIETEWARTDDNGSQKRYLIVGATPQPNQCKLSARSSTQSGRNNSVSTSRDVYFELDVLKRVDAVRHARILQAADVAASAASNQ